MPGTHRASGGVVAGDRAQRNIVRSPQTTCTMETRMVKGSQGRLRPPGSEPTDAERLWKVGSRGTRAQPGYQAAREGRAATPTHTVGADARWKTVNTATEPKISPAPAVGADNSLAFAVARSPTRSADLTGRPDGSSLRAGLPRHGIMWSRRRQPGTMARPRWGTAVGRPKR